MKKKFTVIASIGGFLAVGLGAFGAHGLKGVVSDSLMSAFATGVQYQFYHCLAVLALGLYMQAAGRAKLLSVACWFFIAGVVGFSGSLYGLALGGPGWLGPVTPIGGTCFLIGWLLLVMHFIRVKN